MKKSLLTLATISVIGMSACSPAMATETSTPNPSDLTQVNSFVHGSYDRNGNLKGMLGLAGQYSEGNTFMGLIEHNTATNKGDKAQNTRVRYFQVLDTGLAAAPAAGFSIDYMKGWEGAGQINSDIVAAGFITKVTTPWDALTLYPNVAYVTGKVAGQSVKGYQTNLFASLAVNETGSYVVVQPQWMDTNVGSTLKVRTAYGAPLTSDGKIWWNVAYTYTQSEGAGMMKPLGKDTDNKFSVGVSYFF